MNLNHILTVNFTLFLFFKYCTIFDCHSVFNFLKLQIRLKQVTYFRHDTSTISAQSTGRMIHCSSLAEKKDLCMFLNGGLAIFKRFENSWNLGITQKNLNL